MQRYCARRVLIVLMIIFSFINISGCNEGNSSDSFRSGDVNLKIEQRANRLAIYIVNATEGDIKINKLFRLPGNPSAEINFIIDGRSGVVTGREGSGFIVLPDSIKDPVLNLRPDGMYGAAFRLSDIVSLFGLKKGECKIFQAIYKDPLSLEGVYQGALISNEEKICINE